MKRRDFLTLATTAGLGATISQFGAARVFANNQQNSFDVAVTIDQTRELGRIDPKVYGHQIEHLERIVYGGVFEPGARNADKIGIRQDVVAAMREMGGARVVRWGGNFMSYYHWRDGMGERSKRPRRFDVNWKQFESNHFGTDEYLELCRQMEAEPFVTANMGNGSLEEACEWVEYCRAYKKGLPAKIWGLGNEHFGAWQVGYYTAEEYGRKAGQFAQFMRAVAPDLQFVGVGHLRTPQWNETVLKHVGEQLEWLSLHLYGHRYFYENTASDFDQVAASPVIFEREMQACVDQIEGAETYLRRTSPIKICLEEWNTRHYRQPNQLFREDPRDIADAIFIAGVFNACQRLASRVTMTNYIYFTNAHAPLFVTPNGTLKTATFDVFRLYATKLQPIAVAAETKTETFAVELPQQTVGEGRQNQPRRVTASRLDVSATRSSDGRSLSIALVNRDSSKTARVKLTAKTRRFAPTAILHTLAAPGLTVVNTFENPNRVRAVTRNISNFGDALELPPASVSILEIAFA